MTDKPASTFSDYVVYADESGDHSLTSIDPEFPVFGLAFCIFDKVEYVDSIVPEIQRMKFAFWGHDSVILHESDIRKRAGWFDILMRADVRDSFLDHLNDMISRVPFEIVATTIDKNRLDDRYPRRLQNPYEVALLKCMESLHECLLRHGQAGRSVHVVFESRGKNEDRQLRTEFLRIVSNAASWGWGGTDFRVINYVPVFTKKDANSSGLQLADLTARPIALKTLRPGQSNRAFERIRPKIVDRKEFP